MAKRRRKRQDSPLWQWLLVAALAFGLYKGIDYYLYRREAPAPPPPQSLTPPKTETPGQKTEPIQDWNLESAGQFLPSDAFEDNIQPTSLPDKKGVLLAFAKKVPGKKPDPKGLINTRPGLRLIRWNGNQYQTQEIDFEKLEPSLGGIPVSRLEGLPHLKEKPWQDGETKIYPARIFLHGDSREILAYLQVRDEQATWAPLKNPVGKKMPAAFVLGTTAKSSTQLRQEKFGNHDYLILETGLLNELKPYEGYQWRVQAYYWDGEQYLYDTDYSRKLTEAKKTNS